MDHPKYNPRILITGGSGFIGTNLIDFYLNLGHALLNVDKKKPRNARHQHLWKQIDILDFQALQNVIRDFCPTHVLHLAARTDLDEQKDIRGYNTNIIGLENLMKALGECSSLTRAIFTSSMLVCKSGYDPKNYDDYCPPNLYGESKVIGEKMIKALDPLQYEWLIIRPTSIWGPWFGSPYRDFFQRVINRAYFKMKNHSATKTFGFIGNTVHQIDSLLFLDKELIHKKTFYLGDNPPLNINEWADMIAAQLHTKIPTFPFFVLKCASILGDCLKIVNIKFPLTSFRLHNMKSNNIINLLKDTSEIIPEKQYTTEQGIKLTLQWMTKRQY